MGLFDSIRNIFGDGDALKRVEKFTEPDGFKWILVKGEDGFGAISPNGKEIVPASFQRLMYKSDWHLFKYYGLSDSGKKAVGVATREGKVVVPLVCEYDDVELMNPCTDREYFKVWADRLIFNVNKHLLLLNITEEYTNVGLRALKFDDMDRALVYLNFAAKMNSAEAQCQLAELYKTGKGVDVDNQKAKYWYERAAQLGDAVAMYFLGMFYFEGVDGERDRKKAAQYFRRSADIGNVALAQFNLAQMLYRGDDIPQNYEEAFHYFKLCAEQGDSEAMLQLCKMCSNGEGVKQNHNEALRWAQMSANKGNVKGKQMVEALFNRN
jgi:hypothetical protein